MRATIEACIRISEFRGKRELEKKRGDTLKGRQWLMQRPNAREYNVFACIELVPQDSC